MEVDVEGDQEKSVNAEEKLKFDTPLKIDVTSPTTGTVHFLSPKLSSEETIDVEEFYVKYKNL